MGANLNLACDIADRLHETWTDAWFHEGTRELIVDAVRRLSPAQLKSTVTVATAILKANPFSEYVGVSDDTGIHSLICDDIDGLLNEYARFCDRQLVLEPIMTKLPRKSPVKALPPTPAQKRAIDAYFSKIAHHTAMATRQFNGNVIDLVRYRAQHCA